MSAGITIVPGTFSAPPALAQYMGVIQWPVAAVGMTKKKPMQWHSMPQYEEVIVDDFDASPMEIPPFTMGYGELLFGYYRSFAPGFRYLPMSIEWRDMPADRTIEIYNVLSTTSEVALGDGQVSGNVRFTLATARADGYPSGSLTQAQADYMDGRTYEITEQAIIDSLTVSSVLWNFHMEMYLRVRVKRTSDNATLKTFTLAPQIAATMTADFNPAIASGTLPDSGRAIRITRIMAGDVEDFTIQTPEGFSY